VRSAFREAAAGLEQALDTLRHLPEGPERTKQAIDLHLDAVGALVGAGAWVKTTEHIHEAKRLAEALGDERRLGRTLASLAALAWSTGDPDQALELSHRALAIAIGHNDESLQALVGDRLGVIWQAKGDYRQAVEHLSRGVEARQDDRRYERAPTGTVVSIWARDRLAACLAELGDFAEAMARAEEAGRIAREIDHALSQLCAYRSLGLVSLRRGDLIQAIPPLEHAVELCRGIPAPNYFDGTAARLGYAYALSGRLPEGVALIEEALANPAAMGGVANHPLFLAYLGEAHLLAGRPDDALRVARSALDLAHRQKERGNEAWVLRLLGEIAAHADSPDVEAAQAHYSQALARAEELGMRPLVAHCHLGLGKLYRRTSKREPAQEHLTTATAMYREMGMGFWLARAETQWSEST
jgi:tetratricopeptide (TPR) repeat protein